MKKILILFAVCALFSACDILSPFDYRSMKQNAPLNERWFPEYVYKESSSPDFLYYQYVGDPYSLSNFQKAYDLIASGELDVIDLESEDGKVFKQGYKLEPTNYIVIAFPRDEAEQDILSEMEGTITTYTSPYYYSSLDLGELTEEVIEEINAEAVNYKKVFEINPYSYTVTSTSVEGHKDTETLYMPAMYIISRPYDNLSEFSGYDCKIDYPAFHPNKYDSSKYSKEHAFSRKALIVLESTAKSIF